jgi:hypothetical protein
VVRLVSDADRRTVARGANPTPDDVFVIETEARPAKRRLTIQGYEMEVTETGGRYPRVRPTDVKRTYSDVPYLAKHAAQRTVRLPRAYLIAVRDPEVIARIRAHGIAVERLTEPATATVEAYSVTKLSGSQFSDQGHYNSTTEGTYSRKEVNFPPGSYVVSTAQPLANVAAYLLEPESNDGMIFWNVFDRYLAFQWIPQPMEYPVYKLYEPARLITETVW